MIVLLAAEAGARGSILLVFSVAVITGEVSIGWSNDAFDAGRDAAAGRTDKPIVAGLISRRSVAIAAGAALGASVVLSYRIGPVAGTVNLIMMMAGWLYNVHLKSTIASGLMYVVGFGLIPVFAASVVRDQLVAKPWVVAAAAMLALGAHFANVLPDLAMDRDTGVRGLPQRVAGIRGGPVLVRFCALLLLLAASVVIVAVPGGRDEGLRLAGLAAAVLLAVIGARASGRTPFFAAIGIAILDVVLLAFTG